MAADGVAQHISHLFADGDAQSEALRWLADRTNTFINVLRPAIRSAVADIEETDG